MPALRTSAKDVSVAGNCVYSIGMQPYGAVSRPAGKRTPGAAAPAGTAIMGCAGSLAAAALIAWVVWSFTTVYATQLGDHHGWWVIGASVVFVMGLSVAWTGIADIFHAFRAMATPEGYAPHRHVIGRPTPETRRDDPGEDPQQPAGRGHPIGTFLLAFLFLAVSSSILFVPFIPADELLRVPVVGEVLLDVRAARVSHYIDVRDYESARRLAGLGLGGRQVRQLSRLTRELGLVELLVAHGADPDSADSPGDDTLLMTTHDPLMIERLLVRGASGSRRDENGLNAGEKALARGDFGAATRLVEPGGEGKPLALAIARMQNDELSRLLATGISPNSTIELLDRRVTPLYYASAFGNTEAVEMLLRAGAALSGGDALALQGAVEARSAGIVRRLVEAGADPALTGHPATDPIYRAIISASPEMTDLLISLGGGRNALYGRLLELRRSNENDQ